MIKVLCVLVSAERGAVVFGCNGQERVISSWPISSPRPLGRWVLCGNILVVSELFFFGPFVLKNQPGKFFGDQDTLLV